MRERAKRLAEKLQSGFELVIEDSVELCSNRWTAQLEQTLLNHQGADIISPELRQRGFLEHRNHWLK